MKFFLKKIIPSCLKRSFWFQNLRTRIEFYTQISKRMRRQFALKVKANVSSQFAGKRVLIPIIETTHYQHQHLLGLAKALQLRGCEVKVLVCNEFLDGCELKSVRNEINSDPCWNCRFNLKNTVPIYGLDIVNVADFITNIDIAEIEKEARGYVFDQASLQSHGFNIEQSVQDSVIRYYYGAVPPINEGVQAIQFAHAKTALVMAHIFSRIDEDYHPDIVLNNMSCYSAWDFCYKYFRKNGNRFRQISLSQFDLKGVTFNQFELFGNSMRFLNYKKSRKNRMLDSAEKSKLEKFIQVRHAGSAPIFQSLNFFEESDHQSRLKLLSLDKKKRNIFLFSNIYWDVGLSEMGGLYTDVISWVLATIKLLKDDDTVQLFVKPHPGEVFDSSSSLKGIKEIISEHYPDLPNNVTIIEPEWKIKTYDLFPYIDLGVIFTGTLGLEMMLSGIPVVSTGATTHFGLGFASEPETESDYKAMLLGNASACRYDRNELELFAYFYFIRSKIPWPLTTQVYEGTFKGFSFSSLDEILPGKNSYLDHLCNCIMNLDSTVAESWPDALS